MAATIKNGVVAEVLIRVNGTIYAIRAKHIQVELPVDGVASVNISGNFDLSQPLYGGANDLDKANPAITGPIKGLLSTEGVKGCFEP